MQNVHRDLLNKAFKINSDGISEFATAQIEAKASVMGLTDSLSTELIAIGKDATFTQKAATGKLTYSKALKDVNSDMGVIGKTLLDNNKLSDDNSKHLKAVYNAYGSNSAQYKATLKDIINDTEGLSDSIIDLGTTSIKSTGFFSGLKNTFTGLYATIKPMLPLIATIGTAVAAYKGFKFLDDKLTLTFDTAQKHLEDSSSAYTNTVSELENLNSQTDQYKSTLESIGDNYDIKFSGTETIDEMIGKLRSIDDNKINLTDESTINKLERENDLLETRKNLLTTTADSQQRKAAEDARASINFASEKSMNTRMDRNGMDIVQSIDRKDYIREQVAEMEKAQKQIDEAKAKIDSGDKDDKWKKQFEQATQNLETYKERASKTLTDLNEEAENFYDKQTGKVLEGYENDVKEIKALNDMMLNIDLLPAEKELNSLDSFFSSTAGNTIGDYLNNIVAESGNAKDALHKFKELGLSLDDIGVSKEGFLRYFQDVANSAKEAKETISTLGTTLSDVDEAFESENQDANWKKFADYATQARDLAKQGKWGTDDLQKSIEWVLPKFDVKKELKKNDDLEYVADVYEKKYKDAEKLYKKFFDAENPLDSAANFQNALIDKGLLKEDETGLTGTFNNTAQAADKMNMSIEATEALLRNLESYGFEWDKVTFSGEGISRYENALNNIKSLRDSMSESDAKDRLSGLIDGWDKEYSKYEKDLSKLTEDKIVHIEFEYNLAQLDAEIAELEANAANSDGKDVKENAALLARKQTRRDMAEKYLTEKRGMEIPVEYKVADKAISKLQKQLKQSGLSEDQKVELQAEISNITDLQNNLLDAFDSSDMSWDEFIKTDTFDKFVSDINEAKERVEELSGESVDMKGDIDTSKIDSKISGILANDGKVITMRVDASTEQIQKQLDSLEKGQSLLFNANVDGKQTGVTASKNEKGQITYTAVIDGVEKILTQNGTVNYTIGSQESPENKNANVDYDKGKQEKPEKQKTLVDYKKGKQEKPDKKDASMHYRKTGQDAPAPKTADLWYRVKGVIGGVGNAAGGAIKNAISAATGGKSKLNGTAHKEGTVKDKPITSTLPLSPKGVSEKTGGLHPIPKLSGRALAMGTLEDDTWLNPNWKTKKDEDALTGEVGQELVVHGNRWFTVGDNGAEFAHIPAGSVVFNAKQTKELLKNGFTPSRGTARLSGTAHLEGTAYASGNGGRKLTGSSSSTKKKTSSKNKSKSSSKKKSSKKSSKKADKDAKKAKETFDLIEVKINRIERAIERLDTKASSVYRSWSSRNTNLTEELKKVNKEITVQNKGYDRYIKEARTVSSDAKKNAKKEGFTKTKWNSLTKKVRDGSIDISTIKNEKLAERIKEYQQWWNFHAT